MINQEINNNIKSLHWALCTHINTVRMKRILPYLYEDNLF